MAEFLNKFKLVEKLGNHKFILYPFGNVGRAVKKYLNDKGYKESYIVDGNVKSGEVDIEDVSLFQEISCDDFYLIITSDNRKYYEEIRNLACKYFKGPNIIDIFGKINQKENVRVETMRLYANRIHELNIPGAVAEAGVYRGDFAGQINNSFPDRKLYLFDTFEGFRNVKLNEQIEDSWKEYMINRNRYFDNCDIDMVMEKMRFPEQCIIRKGFFPDTIEGLQEKFCYVSIDMDVYQSTKDGLEYFWPRMSKYGAIMIHDYNSYACPGVKKAVDEFCKEEDVGIFFLADKCGSVMLIK